MLVLTLLAIEYYSTTYLIAANDDDVDGAIVPLSSTKDEDVDGTIVPPSSAKDEGEYVGALVAFKGA